MRTVGLMIAGVLVVQGLPRVRRPVDPDVFAKQQVRVDALRQGGAVPGS